MNVSPDTLNHPDNLHIHQRPSSSVDLRIGIITEVQDFPRARNPSYKIWADFGNLGTLCTSAQVTAHYKPDHLIGKHIVACVNLGSRNIAGFLSQFLLLGFQDKDGYICIMQAPSNSVAGDPLLGGGEQITPQVKFEDFESLGMQLGQVTRVETLRADLCRIYASFGDHQPELVSYIHTSPDLNLQTVVGNQIVGLFCKSCVEHRIQYLTAHMIDEPMCQFVPLTIKDLVKNASEFISVKEAVPLGNKAV